MFETHILPVLIFAALGLLSGILLTVASKVFEVKVDERVEQIGEVLPQANCGACGYAGCEDYAKAIVNNNAPTNACKPGGNEAAAAISAIMGTKAESVMPEVAVLHCSGNCNVTEKKYNFNGFESCTAAKRFYGGDGMCDYGCIGLGDCIKVCTNNAISIRDGIAHIDKSLCTACGMCVKACGKGLISIRPVDKHYDVLCSSKDNGKLTKQKCKNGCIGCKICEKKCPVEAIKVVDFHAVIDYTKCTGCGACAEACPSKCIVDCSKA